jgi:murein L,D-transpeptidase YafK
MRRRAALLLGLVLVAGLGAGLLVPDGVPARAAEAAADVALVRVEKSARRLTLLGERGEVVRVFPGIQLGDEPLGAKQFEGDERTPEGRFVIDYGNENSAYHLSLHISYPDPAAVRAAAAQGRSPGGLIFIHGQPNWLAAGSLPGDWTAGCIALSNAEMDEVWTLVPDGTPIEIVP